MAAGHFCHVLQMVIVDDLENIGIAIGVFPIAPPSKSRKRVQFVDDDQGRDGSDTLFAHAAVHRHARGRVKFDGPETHTQALSDLGDANIPSLAAAAGFTMDNEDLKQFQPDIAVATFQNDGNPEAHLLLEGVLSI